MYADLRGLAVITQGKVPKKRFPGKDFTKFQNAPSPVITGTSDIRKYFFYQGEGSTIAHHTNNRNSIAKHFIRKRSIERRRLRIESSINLFSDQKHETNK